MESTLARQMRVDREEKNVDGDKTAISFPMRTKIESKDESELKSYKNINIMKMSKNSNKLIQSSHSRNESPTEPTSKLDPNRALLLAS